MHGQNYSWSLQYFYAEDQATSPNSFENTPDNTFRDRQYTDKAIQVIEELKQNWTKGNDMPFFLADGFHKPHLPMHVPSKYCDLICSSKHAPNSMEP